MFGDTLAQEIISAIVVSALAFSAGFVIRKGRKLAKVEKTKISVFKVLSLPDDPENDRHSFFFMTAIVASRSIMMSPLEFGTSGRTIKPYEMLPTACDATQESYPYAKSVKLDCKESTSCMAMAGTVGGANVNPEDHWFGAMVVEDGMESTVIADFSSVENFDERVKYVNVGYWKNMNERAPTNPATRNELENNVFVGHVEAKHALKGHIVKIEFQLV